MEAEIAGYKEKEERRNKRKKISGNGEISVADIISDWTKIPVQRLTEGETRRLARLEKELHKRVIGQDEAVKSVAQAVKTRPCWPERSESSNWFLPFPGTNRCR